MAPAPGARHSFTWFTGFTWLLSEGLSEEWPKYSIRFFFWITYSDNAWGCNVRGSPVGRCENLEVTGAHDCWEMLGVSPPWSPTSFQRNSRIWAVLAVLALLLSSYGWNMMLPAGVKRPGPGFAFRLAFRMEREVKEHQGSINSYLEG